MSKKLSTLMLFVLFAAAIALLLNMELASQEKESTKSTTQAKPDEHAFSDTVRIAAAGVSEISSLEQKPSQVDCNDFFIDLSQKIEAVPERQRQVKIGTEPYFTGEKLRAEFRQVDCNFGLQALAKLQKENDEYLQCLWANVTVEFSMKEVNAAQSLSYLEDLRLLFMQRLSARECGCVEKNLLMALTFFAHKGLIEFEWFIQAIPLDLECDVPRDFLISLAQWPPEKILPFLTEVLAHPNPKVRFGVLEAIRYLAVKEKIPATIAFPLLELAFTLEQEPWLQTLYIEAIAKVGGSQGKAFLTQIFQSDAVLDLRVQAASALLLNGTTDIQSAIENLIFANLQDETTVKKWLGVLSIAPGVQAETILSEFINNPNASVSLRKECLVLLALRKHDVTPLPLLQMVQNSNEELRHAAISLLTLHYFSDAQVQSRLQEAALNPQESESIRTAALFGALLGSDQEVAIAQNALYSDLSFGDYKKTALAALIFKGHFGGDSEAKQIVRNYLDQELNWLERNAIEKIISDLEGGKMQLIKEQMEKIAFIDGLAASGGGVRQDFAMEKNLLEKFLSKFSSN